MNEAILGGLLKAGTNPADVVGIVLRTERAAELPGCYRGINAIGGEAEPENNKQATEGAAVVILGVKPAGIAGLTGEISGSLSPQTIVGSLAAGVTLAQLEGGLPSGRPVIRAVPNTPSMLGRGVVSVCPGAAAAPNNFRKPGTS